MGPRVDDRALRFSASCCTLGRMREMSRSRGEVVGALLVVAASVALVVAAFAFRAGDELAFFVLIAAFAAGTTGFGVHIASREARFRREKR
jgi:hypothetical protein